MSRIVYGYAGEGSGHSSRAREMARFLLEQGHEVRLASYGRGFQNLAGELPVFEISGLTISSSDNRVSVSKTIADNLLRLPEANRSLLRLREELFRKFQPDCVITDFEPMTAYLAPLFGVPLISLDNQHRMRYVALEVPEELRGEYAMTRALIRAMVPWPDVSLVTSLVEGELTNERTFLFPPMVADEVRRLEPVVGDHILVYLTSGFDSLLEVLCEFSREHFVVFGSNRPTGCDGVLEYQPASRAGFLVQLANCKAVIATAGFTLISEALYLRKPYLAYAMEGQFEQQLNAYQLQSAGWGKRGERVEFDCVAAFLYNLESYRARLAAAPRSDGHEIKEKLGELVADRAALAHRFHRRRKRD